MKLTGQMTSLCGPSFGLMWPNFWSDDVAIWPQFWSGVAPVLGPTRYCHCQGLMILTFGSISVGALSVVLCQDWGSYTGWLPIGVSRDMGVDEIGLPETTLWSALVSVC